MKTQNDQEIRECIRTGGTGNKQEKDGTNKQNEIGQDVVEQDELGINRKVGLRELDGTG